MEDILVDDFIDSVRPTDSDAVRYAKFVLNMYRFPATLRTGFLTFIEKFKLYAKCKGRWYRVTMASRLGDIGLTEDFTREFGYELRVDIIDVEEWSNTPGIPYVKN